MFVNLTIFFYLYYCWLIGFLLLCGSSSSSVLRLVRRDESDDDVPDDSYDIDVPVRIVQSAKRASAIEEDKANGSVFQGQHRSKPREDVVCKLPRLGVLAHKHSIWSDFLPRDYHKTKQNKTTKINSNKQTFKFSKQFIKNTIKIII